MKNIFLIAICILIIGCQKEENIYTIKANIEENILKHKDYNNLSSCKIDEINNLGALKIRIRSLLAAMDEKKEKENVSKIY